MVVFAHYPAGETRVQREAEALIRRGFEVDVLCLRGASTRREERTVLVNGACVYRLSAVRSYRGSSLRQQLLEYLTFFFSAMLALIRLYPRRQYATVQVHNLPDFLIFAAWLPKLLGARLVLDLHDLMPEFYASITDRAMNSWPVRLVTLQERLACAFADHVITVTERWRQTLIRRGVPPEKVSVVMNVPDEAAFCRGPERAARLSDGSFRLLYHGAAVPRYGLDLILEAIARLHHEIPGVRCTLHGGRRDEYWESLGQIAARLGIADHVEFSTTLLPMSELPDFIRLADVGLVPYRRNRFTDEILPTKLMEYVAVGLPAIVARTPAIREYFDETMVEFFTPEDVESLTRAIRRLYHDPERRQSLSHNSNAFNHAFNWSAQSAAYVSLLEGLARRPRGAVAATG